MAGHSAGQRSSLEEMLETLRGIDEIPYDVPPALPARPKSKARLPSKVKSRKGMLSLQAAAQPNSGLSVLNTDQMPHRNQKGADSMQDNGFSTPGKRYTKSDSQGFSKIERGKILENGSSTSGNRKSRPQKLSRRHPVIEGTFSLESSNTGSKNLMEAQSVSESPYKEKKNPFEIDDYDMVSASPLSRERSHKWDDVGASSIKKESRAWCVMSESEWALGTILTTSGIESFLSLSNGKTIKMETSKLLPANPEILEGVDDLIQLSYLNEPSVLHSLQHRYFQDMIYTKAGPVLIAVNPFKNVPIFGNEYIEVYRQKSRDSPHVYQMADAAFEAMMQEGVNQSIIISGESGAGKTETAKKAMQYFAGLGGGSGIENEILQTNPILEAFGNAKTSRNNNSSRFGKLIDIHFDDSGRICGANIQTYLLEKSRVVKQTKGERSYHIFYQFCAGASPSLRERLNLMPAEKYFYLNQGDCLTIEEVDDAKNFQGVMEALNVVEISKEDQENVFAMLAAVLWLGNIEFSVSDCENYVEVESNEGVKNAAKLLGCDAVALMRALSTRKIRAGNEDIIQRLTKTQAIDTRDALAKAVYACLFDWLVGRINKSLEVGKHCTGRSICILDIYGFESFEKNSFEQLCINYANERLQQHFNRHLFKLEQEEYNLDGIDWTKVDFIDNQECLDLIEKKPLGVLSLLDEECTFPKGTDLTLANKLKQHLSLNTCFKGERGRSFRINHYAGEVTYDTATFLEKNRDLLHSDLIHLLSSCFGLANSFISNLQRSEHKPPTPRGRLAMVDIQKQSVATKFKGQLFKLMQRLESTSPHFIRCIKPNKSLLPGLFEQSLILQQLRSCGVLEVVRISRSGYPTRMLHQHFAKRYGFLLPPNAAGQDALNVTVAILHQFGILPEMYQIGFTKLFLRSGQLGRLEEIRSKTILGILGVQKVFRGYRTRNQIKKQKRSILCLQSYIRGEESRRKYQELTKRCKAAITIQTVIRQKVAQKRFRNARTLVIVLQSVIRSFLVRQSLWEQIKMDEETSDVKVVVRESISDKISDVRESISDKTSDVSESFSDKTVDVKESISDKTSDVTKESIVDRITNENEELYTETKSIGYVESKSIGVINSLPKTKKRLPLKELKFPDQESENDGTVRVRASYLAELQRRVLEAESLLREKEDDNLLLQQKLYQHESRWSEYESKMTSMEEVWQKQMASLQMSLVAAKKTLVEETFHHPAKQEEFLAYNQSSVPKVKTSKTILPQEDDEFDWDDSTSVGTKTSEYKQRSVNSDSGLTRDLDGGKSAVGELVQEFEHRTQIFTDDADFLVEVKSGLTEATNINPDSELRKLKQTFDAWKKDFKLRLREVKNTLQKCGNENNYTEKMRKKWWGKRNS